MTNVKHEININVRSNTWDIIGGHVKKDIMLKAKRCINITNSVLAMRIEICINLIEGDK